MTTLSSILRRRAEARRREASERAVAALERAAAAGARVVVAGSLARGDFMAHSDVDFVILDSGGASYGTIFESIEEAMAGFPFDLVEIRDLRPDQRARMLERTADASALRAAQG